jgi:hypothetical protein
MGFQVLAQLQMALLSLSVSFVGTRHDESGERTSFVSSVGREKDVETHRLVSLFANICLCLNAGHH